MPTRPPQHEPRPLQPSPRRPRAACTGLVRRALGAAGALALLLGGACAKDPPSPPAVNVDAGPQCELGTRNCACIGGTRCAAGLVCVVGRCSLTVNQPPEEMPPRRPRPRPPMPFPFGDGGAPPGGPGAPDAGPSPDASSPDAG